MHKRLFPKVNAFSYRIYYLALPLCAMKDMPLARNRFAPLSFYDADHGTRENGADLDAWARAILAKFGMTAANGKIMLITMPRVLGYVFNPVSFWMCYDQEEKLRAVLCEVNNTFGQTHTYLCAHPDQREITRADVLTGEKLFHVSPFLPREGHYTFRFDVTQERCGLWVDYYDARGEKQLITAVTGKMHPMNTGALHKAFWAYPLVTFKAIILIHWQALKLLGKGIKYIPKPEQREEKISAAHNITNL